MCFIKNSNDQIHHKSYHTSNIKPPVTWAMCGGFNKIQNKIMGNTTKMLQKFQVFLLWLLKCQNLCPPAWYIIGMVHIC